MTCRFCVPYFALAHCILHAVSFIRISIPLLCQSQVYRVTALRQHLHWVSVCYMTLGKCIDTCLSALIHAKFRCKVAEVPCHHCDTRSGTAVRGTCITWGCAHHTSCDGICHALPWRNAAQSEIAKVAMHCNDKSGHAMTRSQNETRNLTYVRFSTDEVLQDFLLDLTFH